MNRNFTYHTAAKNEAEAIELCKQCHSKPQTSKISTTTFSNVVIEKAELKDGLWTVTGTLDRERAPGT